MTRKFGRGTDPEEKARKLLKVFLRKIRQNARDYQKDWPGRWGGSQGFDICLTNASAPIDFALMQSILGKDADETLEWINAQTCVTRLIGERREVRKSSHASCLKIGWKYRTRPYFELILINA